MTALVCFVVGTRAQLVKMAPVLRCAQRMGLPFRIWFSGQHGESMSDLLDDFGLEVDDRYCGAFGERASVLSLLGWLPGALRECVRFLRRAQLDSDRKPLVVVHGDTLSALVGAVAARWLGASVAHVESGLSSGSVLTPFPEEAIRRLIFRLSHIAYCPNPGAEQVMRRFPRVEVVNTHGNTIVDALRFVLREAPARDVPGAYVVLSVHRFENIYSSERLAQIVGWIQEIAASHHVWFVLHPATSKRLEKGGWLQLLQDHPAVTLSPRLPYSRFVTLLQGASVVVSDGGSNQEELSCLGVPTLLLRTRSERPDGLGRNVILEGDLKLPVGVYVAGGHYHELARKASLAAHGSPSECIVTDLAERTTN